MSKMLYGSIDLNKVDRSQIVTKDREGQPFRNGAKYLNVVVWVNDEEDQYGNKAAIQMSQTQEEREAGNKAVYIGNLKEHVSQRPAHPVESSKKDEYGQDSVPF